MLVRQRGRLDYKIKKKGRRKSREGGRDERRGELLRAQIRELCTKGSKGPRATEGTFLLLQTFLPRSAGN